MGQGAKTEPQKRACHFPWQRHSHLGKLGSASPLLARWAVIGRRQKQQRSGLLMKVVGAKAQKTPLEDLPSYTCDLLTTQQTTAMVINLFSTGISCDIKVVTQVFPSLSTSQYLEKESAFFSSQFKAVVVFAMVIIRPDPSRRACSSPSSHQI